MNDPPEIDAVVDAAWDALERGEPLAALERLAELGASPARWLPEATAWTDLGELARARAALARAEQADEPDDVLAFARAALFLREWRIDEARAALESLAPAQRGPAVLEQLALCADLVGDYRRADRLLREAHRLAPDESPAVPRLSTAAFERVVGRALEALPSEFRTALETTAIVIDPMPTPELCAGADPAETPPDVLGLFVGRSLAERSSADSGEAPPTVYLFQRNLERATSSRAELEREIATTLYHELGHALGFDEDGVEAMGLE